MIYASIDLLQTTRDHFGWLESNYGMRLTERGQTMTCMSNSDLTLCLLFSIDLPRLMYVESDAGGNAKGYDLWHFFLARRRLEISACLRQTPTSATILERNEVMLDVLACALKRAGLEILHGDKSWKADYPGEPESFS